MEQPYSHRRTRSSARPASRPEIAYNSRRERATRAVRGPRRPHRRQRPARPGRRRDRTGRARARPRAPCARAAYRAGAPGSVTPYYSEPHFRRALIEFGPAELPGTPEHELRWIESWTENVAVVNLAGDALPGLYDDLDQARVAATEPHDMRARLHPARRVRRHQLGDRRLADPGLGRARARHARRRAALGADRRRPRASTSPTRSRPGASTARASTAAPRAERARARRRSGSAAPAPTSASG